MARCLMGALVSMLEKQHNTYRGGLWSQKRLWYGKGQMPGTVLARQWVLPCLPLQEVWSLHLLEDTELLSSFSLEPTEHPSPPRPDRVGVCGHVSL